MLLLSSYERAYRFLCVENNAESKRLINTYLYPISQNIQAYINNSLELKSRVEYFDVTKVEKEFFVRAHPITSITSVYQDSLGLFTGGEQLLSDTYVGSQGRSVVLQFSQIPAQRALKVTYIGGVATTATLSTFAISSTVGTFAINNFVRGSLSGAVGIIKAFTANTSIQVDVLYGVFSVGETLTTQATEGATDIGGISTTLDSKTIESLVEIYPEISLACEIQLSYNYRTRSDFEVMQVSKDGTMRRSSQHYMTPNGSYNDLQPEVRSLLNKHRRYIMS